MVFSISEKKHASNSTILRGVSAKNTIGRAFEGGEKKKKNSGRYEVVNRISGLEAVKKVLNF